MVISDKRKIIMLKKGRFVKVSVRTKTTIKNGKTTVQSEYKDKGKWKKVKRSSNISYMLRNK